MSSPPPASPIRVLVVDDELSMRTVLRLYLQNESWEVVTASDGAEGLERFQQERFDLVLTDRAMLGLDGEAMAREIKLLSPHTPIILLSGSQFGLADATPFRGFLTKPFTRAQLRATIAEALSVTDSPSPAPRGSSNQCAVVPIRAGT